MVNFSYISFILLIPIAVFLITGIFGKKTPQLSGILGTIGMLVTACLAYYTAYGYFFVQGRVDGIFPTVVPFQQTWLQFSSTLSIDLGIMLDPISVMMLVVVTTVSLMVHLYSIGYMQGEERYSTYYSFLSLFSFSMLGLVMSTNIFQMYMFWELVGISSFLLIGFYYNKPSAVAAAKKAFIVTRFADLGFLIGILMLSFYSESLDFRTIIARMAPAISDGNFQSSVFLHATTTTFMGVSVLTWSLCLIFMGGAGKSAMFPLHVWLPDAMEGPTPVSALIHAATMVVAGVFLVARLFPVFSQSPAALEVVTYVGAFSAIFAAIIACTQTDIKRVLAYSTMSQIGYMMFSLGVSGFWGNAGLGFTGAMFHLLTHAFFKALLFLGAGAVIHYVHSNEVHEMGGLHKKMPVTSIAFFIACLAISGIPPFAGFFSKEEILTAAFEHNKLVYGIGLFTTCLTAFYMFRLYYLVFWNKPYQSHSHEEHHGEAPVTMLLPLLILGSLTIVAGFIPFGNYISADGRPLLQELNFIETSIAVAAGSIGILLATIFYARKNSKPDSISSKLNNLYRWAYHKFYIDEVYLFITQKVIFNYISAPADWIDKNIVDGSVNLLATATENVSDTLKQIQSGKISGYVIWFFVGAIVLSIVIVCFP